jgi:hypothetical protein
MASVKRWRGSTAIGLAALASASLALSSASASRDSTITVSAHRSRLAGVTLEVYNGRLDASGEFEVFERGYASLRIDDARPTPTLVQCSVSSSSTSMFMVAQTERRHLARDDQPTGLAFELAVTSGVIEFAVTPEHEGDYAYAIRAKDRAPFELHSCTVEQLGEAPTPAASIEHPHRIRSSQATSGSGQLAVAEAEFYKWRRDDVVFDVDDALILAVGPSAPDPVVVRCELDLDLAERTTFEIELLDQQTKISKRVDAAGRLSFTLWGDKRAKISNPTHMWIWQSCELQF